MSVTTVYLARHGRTAFNAEDRMRGLSDPPLDDVGIAEAQKLAAALADKRPTTVISSPLQRAVATAQSIADAAGVPAGVDIRLNDRDYGPHTGAKRADVIARYGSIDNAPGVESLEAVRSRALAAFTALVDEHDGGPLILVSPRRVQPRTARPARHHPDRRPPAHRMLEPAQPASTACGGSTPTTRSRTKARRTPSGRPHR